MAHQKKSHQKKSHQKKSHQKKLYSGLAVLAVAGALGLAAAGASADTPAAPTTTTNTAATREAERQAAEFAERAAPPMMAKTLGGTPVAVPSVRVPAGGGGGVHVWAGSCAQQARALRDGEISSYRCASVKVGLR